MIELMAVVAILGIVLFVVVPGIDGITPQKRLQGTARRIASTMDLAQAIAIGDGNDIVIEYDLQNQTTQIILPPKPQPSVAPAPGSSPAPTPYYDFESGTTSPAPPASEPGASPSPGGSPVPVATPTPSAFTYENREKLSQDAIPDDVEIFSIQKRDATSEQTSGQAWITFSKLGDDGSHIVGVRLKGPAGQSEEGQMWVMYNALTRTFEFSSKKLEWAKIPGN